MYIVLNIYIKMENDDRKNILKTLNYTLGSCCGEIISIPFFTLKTQFQTIYYHNNIFELCKKIYSKHGVKGFYNAIPSTIITRILSSFIKFFIYVEIKKIRCSSDEDIYNNMINGCITGCITSLILHPLDVITNNLQRMEKINKTLFQKRILFAGIKQTLLRNMILYSLLFPIYDFCNYKFNNIFLACFTTCFISTIILHPIEYKRTKLMAGQNANLKKYYRGYIFNLIGCTLHFTTTMYIMQMHLLQ